MFECFEFENGGKRNGGRVGINILWASSTDLSRRGPWRGGPVPVVALVVAGALMISALSFTEQSEHFYTIAE